VCWKPGTVISSVYGTWQAGITRVFEVRVDEAIHLVCVDGYWSRGHELVERLA
jgi:hypothetical protein